MWRYVKGQNQWLFGAGGYTVIRSSVLAELHKELSPRRRLVRRCCPTQLGGRGVVVGQHTIECATEVFLPGELRGLPRRLDAAAMRCVTPTSDKTKEREEYLGLANHYIRSANLVSRYWVMPNRPPPDCGSRG